MSNRNPMTIQPSQASRLVQELKNEMALYKSAGDDTAKAQHHYNRAENIRRVLLDYQAQQKARMAQQPSQPQAQAQPQQSQPQAQQTQQTQPQQGQQPQTRPGTAMPPNTITVENFNQVQTRLGEFERKIQQLENAKKSISLPEQLAQVESQITELKTNYTRYQKVAFYMRSQLVNQRSGHSQATPQPGPAAQAPQSAQSAAPAAAPAAPQSAQSAAPQSAGAVASPTPGPQQLANTQARMGRSASPQPAPASLSASPSKQNVSLQGITKPSAPSLPISSTIHVRPPQAVTMKQSGRPTLSGGVANGLGQVLGSPAITRMPTYEINLSGSAQIPDNRGRVLTKRKLNELVQKIGADQGDGKTVIDGDVEELLLDLADEFIDSVTTFACRLAKHRKVEAIDVKDVQLHLEKNWNIRIPGYAMDEMKTTKKWQPSAAYTQKLNGVDIARDVNE